MLVISRHMALGPPPETSGASYFSIGRIIVDARLQPNIVPAGWYRTHCLCMLAGGASQAHTTTPKTGDNEDFPSRARRWLVELCTQASAFVISNHRHYHGCLSYFAETIVTRFIKAWMSHGDARKGGTRPPEAIPTRTADRDWGLVGPSARAAWVEGRRLDVFATPLAPWQCPNER